MTAALTLAISSSLCFGLALITSRIGLRSLDARAGAAISVPTATVLLVLSAPFTFDIDGYTLRAALWFAGVGLFFPALVTLITFRSNAVLGPTVTGSVSGTAPLFAMLAAALFLGERVPAQAAVAAVGIGAGVALISWKQGELRAGLSGWALLWPVSGAVIRGFAQAAAKAGLLLWPNPFAASLIAYTVSTATVIGINQMDRSTKQQPTLRGFAWFALTGVLNGGAVLLMYAALNIAPVALVSPIIAAFPLVTVLVSAAVLREEPLTRRMLAGVVITVLAIVYLVSAVR